MEQITIDELEQNSFVKAAFLLVQEKETSYKRSGEPYIRFSLSDGQKTIKAVLWDNLDQVTDKIQSGTVVKIQGSVTQYQNELQLTIHRIRLATIEEANVSDFLPRTDHDIEEMMQEITTLIESINTTYLKNLLESFFLNETIRQQFCDAPAAKKLHHNVLGGLVEHTLTVTKICNFLASIYPSLNRDILITASLLHDIGKIVELEPNSFEYSDAGRLLGHLFIGAEKILEHSAKLDEENQELKLELLHAILAHHGSQEWGSPIVPMTIEAMALHYADNLDAKLVSFETWINKSPDPDRLNWSKYWPLMQRYLYSGVKPGNSTELEAHTEEENDDSNKQGDNHENII